MPLNFPSGFNSAFLNTGSLVPQFLLDKFSYIMVLLYDNISYNIAFRKTGENTALLITRTLNFIHSLKPVI